MRRAVTSLALLEVFAVAACAPSGRSIPACEVGETSACACVDGADGTQTCSAAKTFQPCVCDGSSNLMTGDKGGCSDVAANMVRLTTADLDREPDMTPSQRHLSIAVINRAGTLLAQTCVRQRWSESARECAATATTRTQLADCEDLAYRTRGSGTPACEAVAASIRLAAEGDPKLPSEGPSREAELARIARDVLESCERQAWNPEERRCMGNVKNESDYRRCDEMINQQR